MTWLAYWRSRVAEGFFIVEADTQSAAEDEARARLAEGERFVRVELSDQPQLPAS